MVERRRDGKAHIDLDGKALCLGNAEEGALFCVLVI